MTDANQYGVAELIKLARAAEAQGHDALAYEAYLRVLQVEPQRDSARFRAAWNSFDFGRISEAKTLLASLGKPPKNKRWLVEFLLGYISMAQFNPAQAESHFRKSTNLNPTSTAPAVLLGNCLAKQEKLKEAEEVLTEALQAKGDLEEVYLNLALVMRTKKDYVRAKSYLLKALRIDPSYPDAKLLLADVQACIEFNSKFCETSGAGNKSKAVLEKFLSSKAKLNGPPSAVFASKKAKKGVGPA